MTAWEDDWDDDDPDDVSYDAWDDDEDASETVVCPNCGADVYEEAEQCPSCGEYITRTHSAWEGKPLWWIVLGIIGVVATIAILSGLL